MRCCVPNCNNESGHISQSQGVTFHVFPTESGLRKSWLRALGKQEWVPNERNAVCSEHFLSDDLYETRSGSQRLRAGAVPLVLQDASNSQTKNSERHFCDLHTDTQRDTPVTEVVEVKKEEIFLNKNDDFNLDEIFIKDEELKEDADEFMVKNEDYTKDMFLNKNDDCNQEEFIKDEEFKEEPNEVADEFVEVKNEDYINEMFLNVNDDCNGDDSINDDTREDPREDENDAPISMKIRQYKSSENKIEKNSEEQNHKTRKSPSTDTNTETIVPVVTECGTSDYSCDICDYNTNREKEINAHFTQPSTPRRRRRHPGRPSSIITYLDDSGSEIEGGDEHDDDDDDDDVDDDIRLDAHGLREVVRRLEEELLEEERVPEAGDALLEGGVNDHFEWSSDFSTFQGVEETYTRSPGPNFISQDPVEIFLRFWPIAIIQRIVAETNHYAWQTIAALSEVNKISQNLDSWYEVTSDEIYRYFSVIMLMGLNPRGAFKECWTTGVLGMPGFRALMSRNRYQMISRFLHFVNNETIPHDVRSYERKVSKIAPLVDHCNDVFQSLYTPQQQLSLDESLLLWKGRLSWVQCIRTKAARFGIKTFELCEAATGYMLRCIIYAGKNSTMHEEPIYGFSAPTAKVVLKLMDGFLDVGHLLVMDNWCNQLPLTRFLKQRHTDVLGTLNRRRQHLPENIKGLGERDLSVGDQVSCHSGDISLTAWKDVKLVTIISTYHGEETVPGRRAGQAQDKPISVVDYNRYIGGVDLKDQKLSMYLLERKRGTKWYIKVFRRLLNTSILNSYIIYCRNPVSARLLTHRQFRTRLAEGLLARFPRSRESVLRPAPPSASLAVVTRLNSELRHFPVLTELLSGNRHSKRRCAVCSARGSRRLVTIICRDCKVGLCVGQCWDDYHCLPSLTNT